MFRRLKRKLLSKSKKQKAFSGSTQYWEERYASGRNSGAGSRNRLAEFKANILNNFVREREICTIIELGCGDGKQLQLADYPNYVGVDVSDTAINLCKDKFTNDATKRFVNYNEIDELTPADLCISLDVIYHLVEDDVYHKYMSNLFSLSERFVCIYSSNEDRVSPDLHVRHRHFQSWIDQNASSWTLLERIANAFPFDERYPDETSFSDFYIYTKNDL